MTSPTLHGQTALVTSATSGIDTATAQALTEQGVVTILKPEASCCA